MLRAKHKNLGGSLLAALLFVIAWTALNPAHPHLNTSDLYTHLTVARHLVQGDGFLCDVAYPLSFAFDFARDLPQPLIHRGPGYALLLTIPISISQGDPHLAVQYTRILHILFMAFLVFSGSLALFNRHRWLAILPWIILLGRNPLMGFAVDWAFIEVPCALLLFLLWIRIRDGRPQNPDLASGAMDGLLAGLLILLRWDLFWIPLLWWAWTWGEGRVLARRQENPLPTFLNRGWLLVLALIVLINLPWLVRNTRLTGDAMFSLQGQAELVKDTRDWPGYSVYKQLQPQPLSKVLSEDPVPVMRKFLRGLKFNARESTRLLPWPALVLLALVLVVYLRGSVNKEPCPLRRNAEHPMSILPEVSALGPLVMAAGTLALLMFQYSCFDHSLRHLLVVVPLITWEIAIAVADLIKKRQFSHRLLIPTMVVAVFLISLTIREAPGWQFARQQALSQARAQEEQTRRLVQETQSVPFVKTASAPWYAQRAAVWDPENEAVRQRIRLYLQSAPPESGLNH